MEITNSETINELRRATSAQMAVTSIPTTIAGAVVPTIEISPSLVRPINVLKGTSTTASGGTNILTTDTDKDFFLYGAQLSFSKNVTCDIATGNIYLSCTDAETEASQTFCCLAVTTLIAENGSVSMDFKKPIKIKRGTAIAINSAAHTAGALAKSGSIYGEYVTTRGN